MAQSPAHQWGQIVGHVLEEAIEPLLSQFAHQHGFYLDRKGSRGTRSGKKATWTDLNGNKHDLDFVLERNGSYDQQGTPVAFIEVAWRRYTKHSRNKAQEIQGAILPLGATYKHNAPFTGAVLAGVFTAGSLTQLKSLGFHILYFSYDDVVAAFRSVGIDASYGETTADAEVERKVSAWANLAPRRRASVARRLVSMRAAEVDQFMAALRTAVTRELSLVRILPLHGRAMELPTVEAAISFIEQYDEAASPGAVDRYEVEVLYKNGDRIEGQFGDKFTAIQFLQSYRGPAVSG